METILNQFDSVRRQSSRAKMPRAVDKLIPPPIASSVEPFVISSNVHLLCINTHASTKPEPSSN